MISVSLRIKRNQKVKPVQVDLVRRLKRPSYFNPSFPVMVSVKFPLRRAEAHLHPSELLIYDDDTFITKETNLVLENRQTVLVYEYGSYIPQMVCNVLSRSDPMHTLLPRSYPPTPGRSSQHHPYDMI